MKNVTMISRRSFLKFPENVYFFSEYLYMFWQITSIVMQIGRQE